MNLNQAQTLAQNPLEYKPVGKLLLSFSVPAIISCLINSIYNIVDQIFIGWGVGYLGNAATTVAFPIMTIVLAFATMIGSGGGAFAAIKLGEKEEGQAKRTLNNVVTLSVILGVVVMAVGLIFLEPVLRLFGAIPSVMPYAKDYTFVILLGIPFSILSVSLSNMARTDGSPRMSMYGVLIGAVLNTILDPIYIFVFHWGVTGAAVATVTSQVISTVVLLLYFIKRGHMRLDFDAWDFRVHYAACCMRHAGRYEQFACLLRGPKRRRRRRRAQRNGNRYENCNDSGRVRHRDWNRCAADIRV